MPSHQERVRRNYPEGVPAFGHSDPWGWERNYLAPARGKLNQEMARVEAKFFTGPVTPSEVPRPPLTVTEPPAAHSYSAPQAARPPLCELCQEPVSGREISFVDGMVFHPTCVDHWCLILRLRAERHGSF